MKVNGEINGMITRDKQELISKEQIEMDTLEVSVEVQVSLELYSGTVSCI